MSIVRLKDLAEDLAELLVTENLRLIESRLKNYGFKETRYAATILISRYVAALVYRTLTETPNLNRTEDAHESYVMSNVADLKNMIQNSVAEGFQDAMTAFSGRQIEYYCLIKPTPEPTTNTIN